MTRARETLIDLNRTSYYHCISRCVRRAFLCGEDHLTGQNYEHRKAWVTERLDYLAKTFAIDICSYAVMSNHYHVVLRVDVDKANQWSKANVVRRWDRVCKVPDFVSKYLKGEASEGVRVMAQDLIDTWRERLTDISWFMRFLNEHLAREANKEDNCKGRFWEGRFKSQALLDEAAVLTAMAYVDLNPIRADRAKTPEQSDFTSIKQRIRQKQNKPQENTVKLLPLKRTKTPTHKHGFSFSEQDYFELVDTTGRIIREDKRGYIPNNIPPILERLNLNPEGFIQMMKRTDDIAGLNVVGSPSSLTHFVENISQKFIKGIGISKKLYT
jgi:REP element-mobilizing transposase RayT